MSLSLRDQLLKAGLVTEKQAKQAEQQERVQQHRDHKHRHNPQANQSRNNEQAKAAEARKQALAREQAEKLARDQELNRKREEKAKRRALQAEIRQMIEQHRLPRIEDSEEYFNFVHFNKIHRMAVNAERRQKLQGGQLAIVRYAPGYAVIPPEVAARIHERDPNQVVDLNAQSNEHDGTNSDTGAEDDPYKDFVVPDDLMW